MPTYDNRDIVYRLKAVRERLNMIASREAAAVAGHVRMIADRLAEDIAKLEGKIPEHGQRLPLQKRGARMLGELVAEAGETDLSRPPSVGRRYRKLCRGHNYKEARAASCMIRQIVETYAPTDSTGNKELLPRDFAAQDEERAIDILAIVTSRKARASGTR